MIDGKQTWNFEMLESFQLFLKDTCLPSDFCQRPDYKLLKEKNYDRAKLFFLEIYGNAQKDDDLRRTFKANIKN